MVAFWLLLLLIQVSLFPTVKAFSPTLQLLRAPISLTETVNQTGANNHGISVDDELSMFYIHPGSPIPKEELRHTLSIANSDVQAHLPHDADRPIATSAFEKTMTFPETGDSIWLWVYAYGHGLSWRQLSEALTKVQAYMLGTEEPGHIHEHCQELEFYVALAGGIEVARGAMEYTPGTNKAVAVAKRRIPDTATLQLVQADLSSSPPPQGTTATTTDDDLPITFTIAKNLDLKVTEIGLPIPEPAARAALDRAFTDVVLTHDDIDAKVPKNLYPYAFKLTSGTHPHQFTTEVIFSPSSAKRGVTWAFLCIFYYGLVEFMRATEHWNVLRYELVDARLGTVGFGEVQYYPSSTAGQ